MTGQGRQHYFAGPFSAALSCERKAQPPLAGILRRILEIGMKVITYNKAAIGGVRKNPYQIDVRTQRDLISILIS